MILVLFICHFLREWIGGFIMSGGLIQSRVGSYMSMISDVSEHNRATKNIKSSMSVPFFVLHEFGTLEGFRRNHQCLRSRAAFGFVRLS